VAYAVASAARLPFDDGSFDCVVAYNVLMDVEECLQWSERWHAC
jgi:ubiquinone/menaquinone biosynthesis C-methylase UbiE